MSQQISFFPKVTNSSAMLLPAVPLTVVFSLTVIKQQQVRRCRHKRISTVQLVTGVGHGIRRHSIFAENLLWS